MAKPEGRSALSPALQEQWGFVPFKYLILATPDFIVCIDNEFDLDWKTTLDYDKRNADKHTDLSRILNSAANLEAADWDNSSEQKILNYRRPIGEALARAFEGNFPQAEEMLKLADNRRIAELARRRNAIEEQINVKNHWLKCRKTWTFVHYAMGIAALLFSSLAATKTEALGLSATATAWCSWLTVFCTAMLTFLSPERKSNKYARAWSILNNQIALYGVDYEVQLKDVVEAYNQGENIIFDTDTSARRRASH